MRRVSPRWIATSLGLLVLGIAASAQVVNYTWSTEGVDGDFTNPANWEGGTVPVNDGNARLILPRLSQELITLPGGEVTLNSIFVYSDGYPGSSYTFSSDTATTLTFAPSAGGAAQDSTNSGYERRFDFDSTVTVNIATDQYWTASVLTFDGAVGGTGRFRYLPLHYYSNDFYNTGTLTLNGPGNFAGGFETSNVNLYLNHVDAVAGGPLFLTNTRLYATDGYELNNDITLSGNFESAAALTLGGPVTLAGNVVLQGAMNISGDIGETAPDTSLGFYSGTFRLSGTNTYTGGTWIGGTESSYYPPYYYDIPATVIFENAAAVPATGPIASNQVSYAGISFTTGVQNFIDHLDGESFRGTVGFDSFGATQTFSEDIDLSNVYTPLGLGSSTSAILTGHITTSNGGNDDYKFGGGGGMLYVASNLDAPVGVAVSSAGNLTPTTVVLQGNNSFSGDGVWVNSGILIFDGANALPGGVPVFLEVFEGSWNFAYAGITENVALTPNAFLAQLTLNAAQSVLGLDSANPNTPRTVSDDIDLTSAVEAHSGQPVFIGTTTDVTLTGNLNSGGAALSLTGIKDGELTVNSVLTDANIPSLTVGLSGATGAIDGTVRLNGDNSFSGGTQWQSGNLVLGSADALGTGTVQISTSGNTSALTYTGDFTVANNFLFDESGDINLGDSASAANLTLTGAILGTNFDGFTYVGGGTLTYAGNQAELGWLNINTTTGGAVIYDRPGALSRETNLTAGNLEVQASTDIMLLNTFAGTTVTVGSGATLSLLDNGYGEGPVGHYLAGTITGAGGVRVEENDATLLAANSYTGGTVLNNATIGFTQNGALGSGQVDVTSGGGRLFTLAPDLSLANNFALSGQLEVGGGNYFGYLPYPDPGNRDFTLTGTISGTGSLLKGWQYTLTLSGNNTFAGGITITDGTVVFAHDHAAGSGMLTFTGSSINETARFTTAAPVIGGLAAPGSTPAHLELAAASTLTINQAWDSSFWGFITGSGAALVKTGAGFLDLGGGGGYDYNGGTTITDGGIIFNDDSLIAAHPAGAIHVGANSYAGLGAGPSTDFASFLAKVDPASLGTIGIDGWRVVSGPIDLTGLPDVRLGSSSIGTISDTATIIPATPTYRFGGGGGQLVVSSTLTSSNGLDVTSPANQPLTLWLLNNNYFSGPMTVTNSAAIFGPLAISYLNNIQLGAGGYVGSTDPQLEPADFLAHFAPGTGTGMVGFDEYNGSGRTVGGAIDLSGFGPGIFLGTATNATLRGPISLPGGVTSYNFGAYKGGILTVATALDGTYGVVIGDPYSYGTMRDPHYPDNFSTVVLAGLNTYTGGTKLNAGELAVTEHGLGGGTLTVQPNTFPETFDPKFEQPQFTILESGTTIANDILLNGWLRLGGSVDATLAGTISGVGGLNFQRSSDPSLTLSGTNTYEGGTIIGVGNVRFTNDSAFGTGTITTMPDGALITGGGPRTLENPLHVSHYLGNDGQNGVQFGGDYALTLNGPITFDPGVSYLGNAGGSEAVLPLLRLNGGLSGDSRVIFDTRGLVWLAGTNTYTGGTNVNSGQLIFDSVASLPSVGNISSYGDYIGLATPTASVQTDFIDRFDTGYGRVFGFDSPDVNAPNVFSADIDLRAFNQGALSSATAAVITGNIIPNGDYYFSGAGGGVLTVASDLTGAGSLHVNDSSQPFLLQLSGNNTLEGTIEANGPGIIFVNAASLPEFALLHQNDSTGSYFGVMDPAVSVSTLAGRVQSDASSVVIGVDSADVNAPRTVTSPDLSHFGSNPSDIYLGTATAAIIDGTIVWPTYNRGYEFAAYRTGWLTVNAVLDGSAATIIGNERQGWTLREINGAFPTIELAGDNSYTGGTDFYGGQLVVSHASALGTGSLDLYDPYGTDQAAHRLLLNTPTVANNIFFTDGDVNLQVATTQGSASLTGDINGFGSLTKVGPGTIHLTGDNSFGGTVTIEEGILQLDHASASGAISNTLRFAGDGGIAHFTTGSPNIGHLESERGVGASVDIDAGVSLTVGVHNDDSAYTADHYYGTITGAGSLVKEGFYELTLHGASDYSGGTTINQGKLVADNAAALGTGTVTLNGGDLGLGRGVTVNNTIVFGGAGGKLSGSTTFTAPVSLGAGGGLSPGNSPGTMTFASDLTLAGSSFLDFEIQDPTGAAGSGYDTVVVGGTLFVTSTPATPFVINLLSLDGNGNAGQLQLSDPNATYSLLVISSGAISGFSASNFTLNTSGFSTNFGTDFQFALFQSGNEIRLDFSAVPEPSTYALLGVGALLLGLAERRRRARRG